MLLGSVLLINHREIAVANSVRYIGTNLVNSRVCCNKYKRGMIVLAEIWHIFAFRNLKVMLEGKHIGIVWCSPQSAGPVIVRIRERLCWDLGSI